jgi:polynucleotide 5'-kinase involved in rRNA processing
MNVAKTPSTAAGMPLFGRLQLEEDPEIRTTRAADSLKRSATRHAIEAVDLAGKPKAFFLIGLGSTGKTTLARWIGWRMAEQGRQAILAALDPGNRSLVDWFEGVEQPETRLIRTTRRAGCAMCWII